VTPPPRAGSRAAATALETLRSRYPGQLVLVDAGDLLQGNPSRRSTARYDKRQPHPIVDALNALQYDVVTPGNHDFDFGLDFLRRAATQARIVTSRERRRLRRRAAVPEDGDPAARRREGRITGLRRRARCCGSCAARRGAVRVRRIARRRRVRARAR